MAITLHQERVGEGNLIVRATYEDPWTWEQYVAIGFGMLEILDRAEETVDFIIDMRRSTRIPTGLSPVLIRHADQHGPLAHPRIGIMVVVATARIHKVGYSLFCRLMPRNGHKLVLVPTLEQAHSLLAQRSQPVP